MYERIKTRRSGQTIEELRKEVGVDFIDFSPGYLDSARKCFRSFQEVYSHCKFRYFSTHCGAILGEKWLEKITSFSIEEDATVSAEISELVE